MVVYFTIEIRIFRTTPFFLYTLYIYIYIYIYTVDNFVREDINLLRQRENFRQKPTVKGYSGGIKTRTLGLRSAVLGIGWEFYPESSVHK